MNSHLGYAGNNGLFPIITNEKLPKRASKKPKLSFVATNKLFQYRAVKNFSIVLRHFDIRVSEHLCHILYTHTISQAHRCGVGMGATCVLRCF